MARLFPYTFYTSLSGNSSKTIRLKFDSLPRKARQIMFLTDQFVKISSDLFSPIKFQDITSVGSFSESTNAVEISGDLTFQAQEPDYFEIRSQPEITFTNTTGTTANCGIQIIFKET